ncbi:DUF1254 domain-containing protein [Variovorax sp. J22R24]|uniref:DUF1254 domain-containing protein n=1 Tax=Variovorax gracilis TaxID=3053502 RepID=UPI0025770B80|nr:DUF1254 domain-containing protein [Variovorax sp. J22R24]MDM0108989.1 DUF1254 domain-containing protein [Variovorax sp. J22R24]
MDSNETRRSLCIAMTLGALGGVGVARAAEGLMLDLKEGVEDSVDSLKGDIKARQARDLAIDAYVYAYPLVTMELTRRTFVNTVEPDATKAPMGQFLKLRGYPAVDNHAVTAPNADTLYTILWLDVTKDPWVVSTPDMKGRYFLLPMLDGWTNVFDVPGKRTTGTGAQKFAITGPGWKGSLPPGVKQYKSPTGMVWMLGRIYCTGTPEDYAEVHALQDQMKAVPLSSYGKPFTPPPGTVDPNIDSKTAVREQVDAMDAASYFALFAQLLKTNPPAAADAPMVAKLAKIGIVPGKDFDASKLSPAVSKGLAEAPKPAQAKIMGWMKKGLIAGDLKLKNGWTFTTKTGLYGTNYIQRALITAIGLGANRPQDAVYPTSTGPDILQKYDGSKKYVMHFPKGEMPPVNGFWSLTMYDTGYFFVPNPINRYTVSQRNKLRPNADGSIDLYIQHESPGPDKEENWLPAPKDGFILMMRLYWPKDTPPSLLDGSWTVPRAKAVG